jgi:hypothetical protein
MSDKPKIGSYIHGEKWPNKYTIYNLDYVTYSQQVRATHMAEPWAVDRGNNGHGTFPTFEQALDYVRDRLSPCVST